jgi:hypothetical protein
MKRTLTSLILSTALALPIASSMHSKAYCLEEKTATATAYNQALSKPEYTFDEFKQALGKRYETLSEEEKKQVKQNFFDKQSNLYNIYREVTPLIYAFSNEGYKELSEEEKKSFNNFDVNSIPSQKLKEYFTAFPWIKKEALKTKNINDNKPNPDIFLLWLEYSISTHRGLNYNYLK